MDPKTCPRCNQISAASAVKCDCGFNFESGRLDEATSTPIGPSGIGGWLILVAIGVCILPIRLAGGLLQLIRGLDAEVWHAITTPGTRAYHPLFGSIIVGELIGNSVFLLWSIGLAYLFFTRRRRFPPLMITFMLSSLAFVALDLLISRAILAAAPEISSNDLRDLFGGVISALIWIPYLQRSKRVRATFVD